MNAKQYREQRDAAWAVLRKMKLMQYTTSQPLRLSGAVTHDSPGGQLTALLPDGTPVDRCEVAREAWAALDALSLP